jgi:hypothetical protein
MRPGSIPAAMACSGVSPWIALRLPVSLLGRLRLAGHKRDVSSQSLIKTWLAEKLGAADGARR